jgi:hypothetical protein
MNSQQAFKVLTAFNVLIAHHQVKVNKFGAVFDQSKQP